MNVLDSSCWIEYFFDSPIGDSLVPIVERPRTLLVPSIVLYEVCKYLLLHTDREYVIEFIQMLQKGQVISLNASLSIFAADISRKYRLSMADSIIYATAMQYNAVLWAADKHFIGLPQVQYFDKTSTDYTD